MKKRIPMIIIILIFAAGVGVLSYPLISAVINNIGTRNAAYEQINESDSMSVKKLDSLFDEAAAYNHSLLNTVILTDPFDEESYAKIGEGYKDTFNVDGNGLIGYIEIPKINVFLPIYHGTSTEVLSKGAGHLNNTSLPIGGESTHSVISAHSAFPTETFFDYLTDLEIGDEFYIYVLNRTLKYEVDQIKVVLPEDTSDLYVVEGEDYVTLLTCTPYSINTHRLLVRGNRVENTTERKSEIRSVSTDNGSVYFLGYKLSYLTVALILGGFVLTVAAVVFAIVFKSRHRKRKKEGG